MKTILRIAKYAAISIYAICGVLLLVFLVPRTGLKALNVATGSMTPAVPTGSLVVIHRVNIHSLKVGDVVTYINPKNTKETITHRIVSTGNVGTIAAFTTKGDANQTADPQILGGNIVGKVVWHAPHAGRVLAAARKPVGLILLVLIPGLLIIIDELRRMVKVLAQHQAAKPQSPVVPQTSTPAAIKAQVPAAKPKPAKRPGVDGLIRSMLVIGLVLSVGMGLTKAQLSSVATLSGNTIKTAVTTQANHLLIERVFIGGSSGGAVCPQINNNNSVINTGPGSINNIIIDSHCSITVTNDTTVTVNNSSGQTSQTGSVSNSDITNGKSATSGDASNSNNSSTTINVDNTGANGSGQWVLFYNPTAHSIIVNGWTITDDLGFPQTLPNRVVSKHGYLLVRASALGGSIGNGLRGTGDHLILKDQTAATIDALSWGSDNSVMNPAVAPIPDGGSAKRAVLGIDNDGASDWVVQIP